MTHARIARTRITIQTLVPTAFTAAGMLFLVVGCLAPQQMDPHAAVQRGLIHYDAGEYLEAIAMFKTAREHNRESPEWNCYIGRCYLKLADQRFRQDSLVAAVRYCDRAIMSFERAYEAFPGYLDAFEGKTNALKRKGQHEAALSMADWAVATCGPQSRLLVFQAREYAQNGDLDRALNILHEAVNVEPHNPAAHAELGRFYARYGNRPAAIKSLRRAHDLDPGAPGVAATLASMESTPRTARSDWRTE